MAPRVPIRLHPSKQDGYGIPRQASSHGANFSGLSTAEAATGSALGWSFMKAINTIVSKHDPAFGEYPRPRPLC
ncbi:uncharacterized protein DSM5745_02714 [Aspergillus mulundensis]|uniref:Uncharacterized protein n=1 Tax=Aspergillus mulundensis TaxID=1810919 RepID=A0A3D8SIH0_9EURO|nr:hypothetical protein DSM5745_02714 [Aspergillus mulundensis]RDW86072.1 hypothetical protein DSM5745_02714 [Aspergillus mulundensis]